MVATAVMAVGMVSALQLFSSALHLAGSSASQTQALVLAKSVLDEAYWKAELVEESYEDDAGVFHWRVEVLPIDRQLVGLDEAPGLSRSDQGDYELYGLIATVTWQLRGREKRIVLSTARLTGTKR